LPRCFGAKDAGRHAASRLVGICCVFSSSVTIASDRSSVARSRQCLDRESSGSSCATVRETRVAPPAASSYGGACDLRPKPEHGEARVARRKIQRRIAGSACGFACLVPLRHLLLTLTHDLVRCWVHKVDPLADNAGDRLIALGIIRNVLGDEALNPIACVRAAIEEGWHPATKHVRTEGNLI